MPVRKIRDVDFTQERAGTIASAIQIGVAANTLATSANTLATTANTLATTANTLAISANTLATTANTATVAITGWSVVNSNFTAVRNRSYFTNTASGPITATLPLNETLSVGDFVTFTDVAGTWSTNPLLIIQNIDNLTDTSIAGNNFGHRMSTRNGSITLTYTGSNTRGFIVTKSANTSNVLTVNSASPWNPTVTPSQILYNLPGTYTFIAPARATNVSVVAVGGGAAGRDNEGQSNRGGGAGGLGWKNNIPVTPGQSYTVVVGAGGATGSNMVGANSYFIDVNTVRGGGGGLSVPGNTASPGTYTGDGGGNGGGGGIWYGHQGQFAHQSAFGNGGGGGAGGYSGNGGDGGAGSRELAGPYPGANGAGGGGGGAGGNRYHGTTGGGGVGVFGQGDNGIGGAAYAGSATGGSNGAGSQGMNAGWHGGGGGGSGYWNHVPPGGAGGNGAIRIIWGGGRSFPFNAANT